MRAYEEIEADMRPGHTFSNMSDFEHWAQRWCNWCRHEDECPIVDAALINTGRIPAEWTKPGGSGEPFHCAAMEATP